MLTKTKFLGEIEIEEKDILNFSYGLPGFPELHKFALLPVEGNEYMHYMQSIEEEAVCFITIVPAAVVGDYDIEISNDAVEALEIKSPEEVQLLAILNIPEDPKAITINLKAPIIINSTNKKAAQELLQDDRFEIKHKLYKGE